MSVTKIKDGGQAFPMLGNVGYNSDWQTEGGMSLRDWFAGQALVGTLSFPGDIGGKATLSADEIAALSYGMADAMLKAREERS